MAPHSSTLAWKIPWMEEPGGLHAVLGVAKSQTRLSDFTFTFHFHALEKEMATHSSVLAWRIPGTGESGELPSMGVAQGRTRLKQLSNSSSSGNERRVEILYTVASFTGGGGLGNCVLLSYVAISIKTGTLDFPSGQVVKNPPASLILGAPV